MKKLRDILYKVRIESLSGSTDTDISSVQTDSRKVQPGSVFVAIKGTLADGNEFISNAIEKGAICVVGETIPKHPVNGITYIQTSNSAEAAGFMAHNFFDQPSQKLKLVGVTGTNGKTTIVTLLYKLFICLGYKCGLISTVENKIADKIIPATHTTPDTISLNELLARMVNEGCEFAFMEVSSHAVHQHRVAGLHFTGAIFSNISHDHLDYHQTFDEYIKAKKGFFDALPASAFALTNSDDKRGMIMLQNTAAKQVTYSLKNSADFKGKILENGLNGLIMNINNREVHFRLIGEFNAYNILAVFGASISLNENEENVLQCLSNITGAEGRFDYMISTVENLIGIVDYAHTPDALINVLTTINKLKKGFEHVITVVGCGGDRDKTKRPVMGQVACDYSDQVIFTSDNPRSEEPMEIINQMEGSLNTAAKRKYISIEDRRQAIKTAVSMAKGQDIILVAGKGHEKYQDIKGVKYHFDDKEVLKEMFELLNK